MRFPDMIVSTRKDESCPAAHCESRLEVHAAAMLGEVGDDETASFQLGDYSIVDFPLVLDPVDAHRRVTGRAQSWGNALVIGGCHLRRESHCDKRLPAIHRCALEL